MAETIVEDRKEENLDLIHLQGEPGYHTEHLMISRTLNNGLRLEIMDDGDEDDDDSNGWWCFHIKNPKTSKLIAEKLFGVFRATFRGPVMKINRRKIKASDLNIVSPASMFADDREPPLKEGNFVCLNSGSPILMVVAHDGLDIIVAWRDQKGKVSEATFPAVCLHRVSPASARSAET